MSERRRHARVPLNLLIQYRFDTFDDFIAEYAANISEGGMFVRCEDAREEGSMVYLQFSLKDGTKLIEGLGRVVRVIGQDAQRGAGMGIEFVNFDEDSRALIEGIVRSRLDEDDTHIMSSIG